MNRVNRRVHDQSDANRRRQVKHDVTVVDERRHDLLPQHRTAHPPEARAAVKMGNVFVAAGREVIDNRDVMALGEKRGGQVRSDEPCAAGDKYPHSRSLQ